MEPISLAYYGPNLLQTGPAGFHPGFGLVTKWPISPAGGRYRVASLLVPAGAARPVSAVSSAGQALATLARPEPSQEDTGGRPA